MVRNETTGAAYRGKNIDRLDEAERQGGYDPNRGWAGYRQWVNAGRVVRKGEHGTACVTVLTVAGPDGNRTATRGVRGFRVFHFDQTDLLTERRDDRDYCRCEDAPCCGCCT